MNRKATALVLLNAQRHYLEEQPDEPVLSRVWQTQLQAAREAGHLIVFVQWDGPPGSSGETFSRGWVIHPDLRAEAGDLRVRATSPDAFNSSGLDILLRSQRVETVNLLALPDSEEGQVTAHTAQTLGYTVHAVLTQA
ncbi:isochorismatase family protein [Deinococcus deserti]|uniref:Putative isochorismatase family protein n=1 Tax=Deinococcus deserti (strain DSM 17065 / CIP 109153 / LMG 22923 / VCD115) TaxID=546414 RepID=C1CY10_DEIDV|nr:isochorismatase family protein [Deinococcus deserti]ACO46966.2 putative isochorismatase family protein [Deinococcus deserti VCD115]